jgi:hypothetical protein
MQESKTQNRKLQKNAGITREHKVSLDNHGIGKVKYARVPVQINSHWQRFIFETGRDEKSSAAERLIGQPKDPNQQN